MEFLGLLVLVLFAALPVWAFVRTFTVPARLRGEMQAEITRLESIIRGMNAAAPEATVSAARSADSLPAAPLPSATQPAIKPPSPVREPSLFGKWNAQFLSFLKTADWEQFTGVKLFAWLGAIALFCGAGFFIKFSIDNNLISPATRLVLGAIAGTGLCVWSLLIDRKKYRVTSLILSACAVGVMYAVVYAAANIYHFFPGPVGFILLSLVSVSAFVLSVYLAGVSISVLGTIGAFAVPILIPAGEQGLPVLFTYLALVNAGLFAVVRRLKSAPLFLLGTAGTVFLLALSMADPAIWEMSVSVTATAMAAVALFTVFLYFMPAALTSERETRAAASLLAVSALVLMLALITRGGPYTLILAVFSSAAVLALALSRSEWSLPAMPFFALTFLAVIFRVIDGFDGEAISVQLGLYLAYGLCGGLGPVLLVRKYGLDQFTRLWFGVFPLAALLLTTAMLFLSPEPSPLFWPLVLSLDLLGLFLYALTGSAAGLAGLAVVTVCNAVFFVLLDPVRVSGFDFYVTMLGAGLVLGFFTLFLFGRLPSLLKTRLLSPMGENGTVLSASQVEWFGAFPAAGIFVILGTSFLLQNPPVPNPGMATGLVFLAAALYTARRMRSVPLFLVSLLAFTLAESSWMLRQGPSPDAAVAGLIRAWSAALWLSSVILPFLVYRPAAANARIWQGLAAFEIVQSLYLIRASGLLYGNRIGGLTAVALFVIKLPAILQLVKSLEKESSRNGILAFHGGALLFYVSSMAVLLLHREWLGLALVFEAAALLWLNRNIRHPGLPFTASLLAPAGLFLLAANLDGLKSPMDLRILNPASANLALAVVALAVSARISPEKNASFEKPRLCLPVRNIFLWLTAGTGFFLVNHLVADWFSLPAGGDSALLAAAFISSFGWTAYGLSLVLWPNLPGKAFRIAGILLVLAGLARTLVLPFEHATSFGALPPAANLPNALFILQFAILVFLTFKDSGSRWPFGGAVSSRTFWGIVLGLFSFAALNVSVAGYFVGDAAFSLSTGDRFSWQLAYSLVWLVYAMAILWAGIHWRSVKARHAALGLFLVTSLKIFFLDLWRLGALYRVASFVGLAVVLILVSFLYQKFLADKKQE